MSERFTETLRAASEPGWSHAVGHRFVKELFAGAVLDVVMARYLIRTTASSTAKPPMPTEPDTIWHSVTTGA
jgi:hypothetical protein